MTSTVSSKPASPAWALFKDQSFLVDTGRLTCPTLGVNDWRDYRELLPRARDAIATTANKTADRLEEFGNQRR